MTPGELDDYASKHLREINMLSWTQWSRRGAWTDLKITDNEVRSTCAYMAGPNTNSIGDLIGFVIDKPCVNPSNLVVLKLNEIGRGKARIGGDSHSSGGGHYILAHASELNMFNAWHAIKTHKFPASGSLSMASGSVITPRFAQEWALFVETVRPLLREVIQRKTSALSSINRKELQKALNELEDGSMARLCRLAVAASGGLLV